VVHVSEILKGWRDDDAPRTSSTSGAAGGAHFNASGGGRGQLGSGGTSTSRNGRGSGGSDFGTRPYWRASGRVGSTAGWSSNAGTERPGGGGGAKASIVSALERAMSRSTYGGGGGGGRMGGGGGHGGVDGSGGGGGRKGEDGKNGEVDLGFLHRCGRPRVNGKGLLSLCSTFVSATGPLDLCSAPSRISTASPTARRCSRVLSCHRLSVRRGSGSFESHEIPNPFLKILDDVDVVRLGFPPFDVTLCVIFHRFQPFSR